MEESTVFNNENEMESTELIETEATEVETIDEEGGSWTGLALLGGIVAAGTAAVVHVYRKHKAKKAGKPRVKKRLRWVEEVEDNNGKIIDVEVDDDDVEENIEDNE